MTVALPEDVIRNMAESSPEEDKARLRREIALQTAEFLARGGQITVVAFGASGEVMRHFNKSELLAHHKQRTRRIRGTCDGS